MKSKIELTRQAAKRLGIRLEAETHAELTEDGVYETSDTRNGRLVANTLAQVKLREKTKKGIRLNEEDITEVLRIWGFAQNYGRLNVLPGGRTYCSSPRKAWHHSNVARCSKHRDFYMGVLSYLLGMQATTLSLLRPGISFAIIIVFISTCVIAVPMRFAIICCI